MSDEPILAEERSHLIFARECVQTMIDNADRIADYGVDALASHALGAVRAQRLEALQADPDAPPFFGRIDNDTSAVSGHDETFHIGRRHVRAPDGDPVVIDWRAPIARAFYRATSTDRLGVALRRRFGFAAGELTSYEDEHLDRGEQTGLASQLLREEIERPRSGPMRDIVATIQPDQDELVRAELDTSICVQGAPGTGKTAVGLHRAAYLLYTYPDRLRRSGVLVVGPNAAFLHYIAQVLPALGEGGIEQTTVEQLVAHAPVRATDSENCAVLKGDSRMATVLERLVVGHIRRPDDDVLALVGDKRYRIPDYRVRRYVDDARRELGQSLRWDTARERLRLQLAEDVRRQREDRGGAPTDAETAKLARSRQITAAIDALWPKIDATAVLVRLYTEPELLARCADGLLSEAEQRLLRWEKTPKSARTARLSAADLVLLDEITGLLANPELYVHVVLDEAQDLSAMQLRAVARRCPLGSMTVLGDLAQATTPWAPGAWPVTLQHLGHAGAQIHPLTAGYRVPGEVLELTNRLLPHIAVNVPAATSIRSGGNALSFTDDLLSAAQSCLQHEGSVAVIAPDARCDAVVTTLKDADIPAGLLDTDERVTVVAASAAKGLEFDSVVVLEPAEIVAAESLRVAGLRRLYVVLTRAVSRLVVVHDQPLPTELSA